MHDLLPLILSVLATAGAGALLALRIKLNGLHNPTRQRYVFIDMLLLAACVEIMLDAVADILPPDDAFWLRFAATMGRGMVAAGVIALVITFPSYARTARTRNRRRDDAPH